MSWRQYILIFAIPTCIGLRTLQADAATLSREQVTDLFSEAKQSFRQASDLAATDPEQAKDLYRKAALRLERIVQDGNIHNGKLYYNIGNAYFRIGDIGRSILYYRRAQLLIPNDVNLLQNLSYARSKRTDQIEEPQQKKILKTLLFWHYDVSAKIRLSLFTIGVTVFCLVASLRLFWKKSGFLWFMGISMGISLLLLGSLSIQALGQSGNSSGVILANEVIARKGNSETYQPSFETPLHAGTEFELIEIREDWYHINLPDGRKCWVPQQSVGLI